VSPVKYEQGFYIPEDDILQINPVHIKNLSHHHELKILITFVIWSEGIKYPHNA
jgi:hypothetical protein